MNSSPKLQRFLFLLSVLLSLVRPLPALARGAAGEARITFRDLGQQDMTITSVYEQEFIDFPVAEGRTINRAALVLHVQHSERLLPELSDIVIAVNNEPVSDIILTAENAADGLVTMDIPIEALQPGENELLLRFNQRLVNNGCSDVGDRDLWTKILSDSSIVLAYEETPQPNELSRFPLPFSTFTGMPGNPQISIVLPSVPTVGELSAAAQLAATLGQAAGWKNPPLAVYTYEQATAQQPTDALIVIGTGNRNPLAQSAPAGVTASPSPYDDNQTMLVVSGAEDAELLRSVSMLSTRSARANLAGAHADPVRVSPQPTPVRPSQSTFSELGLTTKRVRGIGPHDLYYPIDIPYDWKTTSEASVEIHFQHGAGISSASLMTVYINGFETAGIRLDRRNDDDGRLLIQLSPRQIHPGRNWLHLVFDLHMARENCKYRYFEEAWAQVSAEQSQVNLAHVASIAPLDLHYMPSYLIVPNDLSADLFVLPEAATSADLTAMVKMAAKLGTYSDADSIRVQVTTADRFVPEDAPANVIAIGLPESNGLIGRFNSRLPQPLPEGDGPVLPSGGRELLVDEQSGQAAYLEVMRSPWARSGSLLVVSGRHPDLLLRLVDLLPTSGRAMKEQGNVMAVTASSAAAFTLGGWAGASLSPAARRVASAIFMGAFVLIVALGGFIVYRRRASKRGRV